MVKQSKYKVGDYIVANDMVFRKIVGVITDSTQPIYAWVSPKMPNSEISWSTEFELEEQKLTSMKPDFKSYSSLEAGDVLHMGHSTGREYTTVLARVGDMVLISLSPHSHSMGTVKKLNDQLKELTEGEVDIMDALDDEEKQILKNHGSSRWTQKAAGEWKAVEWLCLMNWPIVKE